jgi:hypothetical protein
MAGSSVARFGVLLNVPNREGYADIGKLNFVL